MVLQVAILGAGIGEKHLDGFLALPDRFKVAVVCDLDNERAAGLAARSNGCRIETEIDAVLADPSIDLADICLPPHLHAPVAKKAFESGKHVICEKPVAGSVLEADAFVDAAHRAGKRFYPVFQYRYGRALQQLAALQAADLVGKPLVGTAETHWNRGSDYYAVPWRGKWASERGGAILGHAIHIHDLIAQVFGPVTAVSAFVDTRVNPIETEDCAALALQTASGGLVTSSVTLGSARDETRFRFVFEKLTVESGRNPYAPGEAAWVIHARDPGLQAEVDDVLGGLADRDAFGPEGFAGLFLAIAMDLAGKPAQVVTAADGVRSIELVAAIYHAARTGAAVHLPLDRSLPICADWVPEPFRG